ncbi:gamma interferon inducible lysosomal thiol reductase [Ancylostoma duodenale]|uniref:Gamma interferon inducible lysosomal thiol reductase n=1 Tax=Ancylostoma duodenale TaxID=51022 RepID=A0A0C2D594_9BILA|nr:gamma interferon inducible lysosomal thiol reductase [Ancylostoma duodenale]
MLFILLIVGLPFVSADRCASVPPSLWCSSKELSKECGFDDLCNRYCFDVFSPSLTYQTAAYNQRINITVLIEALCPDCQRFIVDELYPNVYKNFAGFVNIEFIPYGNAKVVNGTIQCQHGPEECSINRFESCLIDSVQTQEQYVPLIYCIENNLRVGQKSHLTRRQQNASAHSPWEKTSRGSSSKLFSSNKLSCLVSRLGERLQEKAAQQTDTISANVWPDKHRAVPWVVVNGISLESEQMMMDHLPYLICEW